MTLDAIIQFVQSEMKSNMRHTGDKGSMNRAKIDKELLNYLKDYKRLLEQTNKIESEE